VSTARLRLELPPDVDLGDEDVRHQLLHAVEDQLHAAAGGDLEKADKPSEPRRLAHTYPQSLIEGTAARADKVFRAMLKEIGRVLAE
jgi:hypothetical protein